MVADRFKDDLSHDQKRPLSLDQYSRDTFASIIKRYLTPTFQCIVALISSKNGEEFPVVRVPSHEQVPIAAKADGPTSDKGRIQGIVAGTYSILEGVSVMTVIIDGVDAAPAD